MGSILLEDGLMDNILEIRNLVKLFPEVRAVDDLSFQIPQGTCFGLLGPNGAGKTTTIEIIEGIQKPTSGEVLFKGEKRKRDYPEKIGIQLQSTELPQFLTVRETIHLFRNMYKKRASMDRLIEMCHLEDILGFDNRKISGGQRQRLFLAMALANDPELVFLDEPTTGLDPQARRHLWDSVSLIKNEGKTVILTTHYMEEAQILCDRIGIVDHGKLIALDTTEALLGLENEKESISIIIHNVKNPLALEGFPFPFYHVEGAVEIQTDDPNRCMAELVKRGIDLTNFSARSHNLEDLFLKLTGKELRS